MSINYLMIDHVEITILFYELLSHVDAHPLLFLLLQFMWSDVILSSLHPIGVLHLPLVIVFYGWKIVNLKSYAVKC